RASKAASSRARIAARRCGLITALRSFATIALPSKRLDDFPQGRDDAVHVFVIVVMGKTDADDALVSRHAQSLDHPCGPEIAVAEGDLPFVQFAHDLSQGTAGDAEADDGSKAAIARGHAADEAQAGNRLQIISQALSQAMLVFGDQAIDL